MQDFDTFAGLSNLFHKGKNGANSLSLLQKQFINGALHESTTQFLLVNSFLCHWFNPLLFLTFLGSSLKGPWNHYYCLVLQKYYLQPFSISIKLCCCFGWDKCLFCSPPYLQIIFQLLLVNLFGICFSFVLFKWKYHLSQAEVQC